MNGLKILSLILFLGGITLIVIGSVYTPPSDVVNLPSGGYKGIGFKIHAGESMKFELQSLHPFTLYIMNESEFQRLLHNGTFNGSLYTSTGKYMHVKLTAPKTDYYYIVVANFNNIISIEVDVSYDRNINWPLFIGGTLIVGIALLLLILDWRMEKSASLDATCPNCHRKVSSNWNYCPYCREELRGEKR